MIMEKLDPSVMNFFVRIDPNMTAKEVTRRSGIDTIIPGMMIDDHLFTPCGYSMNGLLEKYYMTIHVTPEQNFSFVSIETNVPQKCYAKSNSIATICGERFCQFKRFRHYHGR
ncbi:S-adenosylmethionine decarboxylase proenzyme-like protein [Sarcoptes scabiei]|uniref:S-adenosylmethionine decarboxylase proenzyme-like protein n=1 Tax=Sarcoptes scabiei TaxID=52283 RepID=A0A131ZWI9_SARSC|nr:S-adenosylmethionine decarboxylase proenzyme-like protein [Sarcoptes scabiei]